MRAEVTIGAEVVVTGLPSQVETFIDQGPEAGR